VNIEVKLTLSRTYGGDGSTMRLSVEDPLSSIRFVEATLSMESYADLLTSRANVPATAEVRGLEFVGMRRVIEQREKTLPADMRREYRKDKLEEWLRENGEEPGWLLSTYLGSQNSVSHDKDGNIVLRYSVHKFVPVTP
jgi:hypothetical protein